MSQPSHDCHHSEWVDRYSRGSDSLRELCGRVRYSPAPLRLTLGKLCEDNGYSYECEEGRTPNLTKNVKIVLCKCDNFVSIVVPGRLRKIHLTSSAEDSAESIEELTPNESPNQHLLAVTADRSSRNISSRPSTSQGTMKKAQIVYALSLRSKL